MADVMRLQLSPLSLVRSGGALPHDRLEPIEFGGSYFSVCSCGYVGPASLTRIEALRQRCDVEDMLLRSADLLRSILAGSDERRAVVRHE